MTTKPTYTPALRFPDFLNDGEWEVKRLGEIAEKVTIKNKSNEQLPVLTNSATEGVVNQQDYFDREIVTRENLTNYHIIELNDFVYNPRISVAAPVGPISRNKIGIGIMSPLYTIFKFREGNIDFFEQYFRTNCWHQYLKDKANFGARFDRMNISNEDFFNLPIPFPPLAEQRRIAACLSAADEMIASTNSKLEQLKTYKKGLMQNLFNQRGGVANNINNFIKRLRFPEFKNDKEWEEKKVSELFNITRGYVLPVSETKSIPDEEYKYPVYSSQTANNGLMGYYNKALFKDAITWTTDGANAGTVRFREGDFYCTNVCGVLINYEGYANRCVAEIIGAVSKKYVSFVGNPKLMNNVMAEISICIPSLPEQRKIASCLSTMDDQINAYTEKVVLLGQYKKGLMQRMFPQNQMN